MFHGLGHEALVQYLDNLAEHSAGGTVERTAANGMPD